MRCSNCAVEGEELTKVFPRREDLVCSNCTVSEGKDRFGNVYRVEEEVHVKSGLSSKMDGRVFVITGMYLFGACESGIMITMMDKETGRPLKTELDINWIIKIKN